MSKHKSEDYKIIAVKYYLENDTNYTKTCEIFKCSERSLKRWIKRYEELEEIKRLNRKQVSYKITKEQVKYAIQKLKENEQISDVFPKSTIPFCLVMVNRFAHIPSMSMLVPSARSIIAPSLSAATSIVLFIMFVVRKLLVLLIIRKLLFLYTLFFNKKY